MKVLLPLITLAYFASAQKDCTIQEPVWCKDDDMFCSGGFDDNNCPMPDWCMPTKGGQYQVDSYEIKLSILFVLFDNLTFYKLLGPLDNNGLECPVSCPLNCASWEMSCPGGDDGNGCMMPDSCIPMKGNSYCGVTTQSG